MTVEPWPPPLTEVTQARAGDPAALDAVYRAIQPRLTAFLRYHGFDPVTQEEIAADVSEVVITKISSIRKPVTFEAWFWAITRNRIRAWLRRKQRDSSHSEQLSPRPTPPDETVIATEEYADIRQALTMLSSADRNLLWLRDIEGLSYKDIGGQLGAATGTVRVRCHRARQRLGTAYEEINHDPK